MINRLHANALIAFLLNELIKSNSKFPRSYSPLANSLVQLVFLERLGRIRTLDICAVRPDEGAEKASPLHIYLLAT